MRCGHLFNGISGFGLAAHWMGWENVMHCEIDLFCNKVMNYHFPNSYQHEDIRTTDFTIWRGKLDLITGGFPCQPYSTAGKRKGKDDDRHLWPEMLRAIREIQPEWIVGENVRGLTNWNGGLVFDEVQSDLEAEGYEILPFLLPAAGVNAPHRRDRIWFIAYSVSNGHQRANGFGKDRCEKGEAERAEQREERNEEDREWVRGNIGRIDAEGIIAHTGCLTSNRRQTDGSEQSFNDGQNYGREETTNKPERLCKEEINGNAKCFGLSFGNDEQNGRGAQSIIERSNGVTDWANFPTQPPVCNRNDGLSIGLANITFSKWRKESIKALGNAVVPQVVYQIFKAIEQWQLRQE